jgi:hypothetical protein
VWAWFSGLSSIWASICRDIGDRHTEIAIHVAIGISSGYPDTMSGKLSGQRYPAILAGFGRDGSGKGLSPLATLRRENCRERRSATPPAVQFDFRGPRRRRTKCPAKCPASLAERSQWGSRHHLISYSVEVLAPVLFTRPSLRKCFR